MVQREPEIALAWMVSRGFEITLYLCSNAGRKWFKDKKSGPNNESGQTLKRRLGVNKFLDPTTDHLLHNS